MSIGLVGIKTGMTRVFDESGTSIPVTVINIDSNRVNVVNPEALYDIQYDNHDFEGNDGFLKTCFLSPYSPKNVWKFKFFALRFILSNFRPNRSHPRDFLAV